MLVIGTGYSGLEIAARLKYIGVPTLIVDKRCRSRKVTRECSPATSHEEPTSSNVARAKRCSRAYHSMLVQHYFDPIHIKVLLSIAAVVSLTLGLFRDFGTPLLVGDPPVN